MALVKSILNTDISVPLLASLQTSLRSLFGMAVASLPVTTPEQVALKNQMIANMNDLADRWAQAISDGVGAAVSDAVDTFVKSGTVTVAASIPVTTFGTAATQTGTTTAPGTGVIS